MAKELVYTLKIVDKQLSQELEKIKSLLRDNDKLVENLNKKLEGFKTSTTFIKNLNAELAKQNLTVKQLQDSYDNLLKSVQSLNSARGNTPTPTSTATSSFGSSNNSTNTADSSQAAADAQKLVDAYVALNNVQKQASTSADGLENNLAETKLQCFNPYYNGSPVGSFQ